MSDNYAVCIVGQPAADAFNLTREEAVAIVISCEANGVRVELQNDTTKCIEYTSPK